MAQFLRRVRGEMEKPACRGVEHRRAILLIEAFRPDRARLSCWRHGGPSWQYWGGRHAFRPIQAQQQSSSERNAIARLGLSAAPRHALRTTAGGRFHSVSALREIGVLTVAEMV